jgi:pyridoxamine 5'-phosphate oxidase family protein
MSVFTPAEIKYLQSQRLGRIATVGPDGMPHVVPVGFRYNPEHETIDIGGHDFANRKKYRDVQRNPRVAFVVDDVKSFIPWRVREVEIRGAAEILETGGETVIRFFDLEMFRIRPKRVVSWGLEQNDTPENARTLIPQLIQRLLGRR